MSWILRWKEKLIRIGFDKCSLFQYTQSFEPLALSLKTCVSFEFSISTNASSYIKIENPQTMVDDSKKKTETQGQGKKAQNQGQGKTDKAYQEKRETGDVLQQVECQH